MLAFPKLIESDTFDKNPSRQTNENDRDLAHARGLQVLAKLMQFRRTANSHTCTSAACSSCLQVHLPNIVSAIEAGQPITLVLPAFPGKSPNQEKVLGFLPDMAERRSLEFLNQLCASIGKIHAPGAHIIICSDGRVFSDVVGMPEAHVSAYQKALSRMIQENSLTSLSTFNLEDVFGTGTFTQMRDALMNEFAVKVEELKETVRRGAEPTASFEDQEATRLYRGITRFLFEDSVHQGQAKSRTALQKEARQKAYEVIRRSNAWSELIAKRFPNAVRLSIHPQNCGSTELGLRLIGNENWMTPWHGVAVETDSGFILLKRSEAEALDAELISLDGQPSHFRLSGELNFAVGMS